MHANDPYDRVTGRGWVRLPGPDGSVGEGLVTPDEALGAEPFHHAGHGSPPRGGEDRFADDPVLTPRRKLRFLDELSRHGNVRVAAGRVGVSRSGLYLARRRDAAFAAGWRTALCLARDHAEAVLAERALEGVEEPVFYRGELIATRRRFDTRLLLAHLARLDQLCADEAVALSAEDERALADGFDRTLARIGALAEADDLPDAASHAKAREQAYWQAQASGRSRRKAEAAMDAASEAWDAAEAALRAAVDAAAGSGAGEGNALEFKSLSGLPESFCTLSSLSSGEGLDRGAGRRHSLRGTYGRGPDGSGIEPIAARIDRAGNGCG